MTGLGSGQGGVYRVLGPVEEVQAELMAAGWRVAVLPEMASASDFYVGLRRILDLPDWTGANLDALWDVLTDLTTPTALIWPHHWSFAIARPHDWSRIMAVLEDRAAQDPPFAVVLV